MGHGPRARRWWVRPVAAALALAVVAGGCHGHGEASPTPPSPKVAATAALVPAAVRRRGVITVGLDASDPPDEFLSPDGQSVIGMDADLADAIGLVLGLKVTLRDVPLSRILPGVASGALDLGLSSIDASGPNDGPVDLVTYFTSGEAFFESTQHPAVVTGLSALCGYSVAVASGTAEEMAAKAQIQACQSAKKPADNVLVFQDVQSAAIAVRTGRAQLGFFVAPVAEYAVGQSDGQFILAAAAFNPVPYGIAVADGPMARAVLAAVMVLITDGRYPQILAKWFLQAGAISTPAIVAPKLAPPPTAPPTAPSPPTTTARRSTATTRRRG